MTPGTITAVSAGTKQGIFRPQVRIYYRNARYGILCETITKPLRCRSRARAVSFAKEWIATPEFKSEADQVIARIVADPENSI